jgi:hypothetical protein
VLSTHIAVVQPNDSGSDLDHDPAYDHPVLYPSFTHLHLGFWEFITEPIPYHTIPYHIISYMAPYILWT